MSSPATFSMIFSNQTQTSQPQTSQPQPSQPQPSNRLIMGNAGCFRFRRSMFTGINNATGCKTCGGG